MIVDVTDTALLIIALFLINEVRLYILYSKVLELENKAKT